MLLPVLILAALCLIAGVLAFSVSARTREFGVRLAIGSSPRHLLVGVLKQGAAIAGIGIVVGVLGGLLIVRLVGGFIEEVTMPGVMPVVGAALVLAVAAVLASVVPAARAARINVLEALRSE